MRETSEQIEEVLTPEQRDKFALLKERHRHRTERILGLGGRGRHRPPRGSPPPP